MDSKWLKKMAYTINSTHPYFTPYRKKNYIKIEKTYDIVDPLKTLEVDRPISDIKVMHAPGRKSKGGCGNIRRAFRNVLNAKIEKVPK